MEKSKITIEEALFDRVERDGASVVTVEDGHIFGFTVGTLRRLLEDAEASPQKKAVVFVRQAPKEKNV